MSAAHPIAGTADGGHFDGAVDVPTDPPVGRWPARAAANAAATLARTLGPCGRGFGILMYHRVAVVPPGGEPPTWNVTPARFEEQIAGLLDRGWEPLALDEALARRRDAKPIPRASFVVTFDDGYANNLTAAVPVLERLGVPATVFVATAYLGSTSPFPSDDWSRAGAAEVPADAWRPLTRDECRDLAAHRLVSVGLHTHTHADFRERPADLVADLETNRAALAALCGDHDFALALPYGAVAEGFASEPLLGAARQVGVTCALTTDDVLVGPRDDPFGWGRFTAEGYDTAETLAGKLSGWFSRIRAVKSGLKAIGGRR